MTPIRRSGARAKAWGWAAPLLALTIVVAALALAVGVTVVTPAELASILLGGEPETIASIVVWDLRLPRVLVGLMAGSALAASGCLLQSALDNDLADPGLLGVSSGASLAVALIVVLGLGVAPGMVPVCALAGGVIAGLTILAATRSARDPLRMILVGAAVTALFNGLIVTVVVLGDAFQIQTIYAYLVGSLVGRGWPDAYGMAPWLALGLPSAFLLARTLALLRLGDAAAEGLGLPVLRTRMLAIALAVALTAPVVAACGPIGFIALIAPHLARAMLRNSDVGAVLPIAMLIGALLLSGADLLARVALTPMELPVGLFVTAVGAPAAIVLLRRRMLARAAA